MVKFGQATKIVLNPQEKVLAKLLFIEIFHQCNKSVSCMSSNTQISESTIRSIAGGGKDVGRKTYNFLLKYKNKMESMT